MYVNNTGWPSLHAQVADNNKNGNALLHVAADIINLIDAHIQPRLGQYRRVGRECWLRPVVEHGRSTEIVKRRGKNQSGGAQGLFFSHCLVSLS